jgi:hypothetical protein
MIGNSQTDSLMAMASGVCSIHWHQPSRDIVGVTVQDQSDSGNRRLPREAGAGIG